MKELTDSSELLLPGMLCTTAVTSSGEAGCDFNSLTTNVACVSALGNATATFTNGETTGGVLRDPAGIFGCDLGRVEMASSTCVGAESRELDARSGGGERLTVFKPGSATTV